MESALALCDDVLYLTGESVPASYLKGRICLKLGRLTEVSFIYTIYRKVLVYI
jgi:hypothetical protein